MNLWFRLGRAVDAGTSLSRVTLHHVIHGMKGIHYALVACFLGVLSAGVEWLS